MVTNNKKKCKLIDFGNAVQVDEIPRIAELLARFYKPPEVILGYSLDFGIDMWSTACSLYELYTGGLLFNGNSDNSMLKQMMELKGSLTQKMLKKGLFVSDHFDLASNIFLSVETDPISKQTLVREIPLGSFKPKDLSVGLKIPKENPKAELLYFKDLLDKALVIDPERRITPEEALRHPFFKKIKE